jgi:hypothetical protein
MLDLQQNTADKFGRPQEAVLTLADFKGPFKGLLPFKIQTKNNKGSFKRVIKGNKGPFKRVISSNPYLN